LEQIARKFLHPTEADEVLRLPQDERNASFLRCWTGKEAVLKALGEGIIADLTGFQVPLETNVCGWIEYSQHPSRSTRCWLEQLRPCDDYVAAVASVERKCTIRTFTFDI
jgi:4'-phosphopantetheinyl transferase